LKANLYDLGKLPPQAVDLEEIILGVLLLQSNGDTTKKIKEILCPEHFYTETHQCIAQAIVDLDKAGLGADMQTVVMQLRKTGKLEIVGGAYVIAELTSKVASAGNLEYHYRCIIELWMKRELIKLAGDILEVAYDDQTDVFTIIDSTATALQRINPDSPDEPQAQK